MKTNYFLTFPKECLRVKTWGIGMLYIILINKCACLYVLTCNAVSRLLVSLSRALVASSSSSSLSCASFSVEICPSAVPMFCSPCCTSSCSRVTCGKERRTERLNHVHNLHSVALQTVFQCGSNPETTSAFYAQ